MQRAGRRAKKDNTNNAKSSRGSASANQNVININLGHLTERAVIERKKKIEKKKKKRPAKKEEEEKPVAKKPKTEPKIEPKPEVERLTDLKKQYTELTRSVDMRMIPEGCRDVPDRLLTPTTPEQVRELIRYLEDCIRKIRLTSSRGMVPPTGVSVSPTPGMPPAPPGAGGVRLPGAPSPFGFYGGSTYAQQVAEQQRREREERERKEKEERERKEKEGKGPPKPDEKPPKEEPPKEEPPKPDEKPAGIVKAPGTAIVGFNASQVLQTIKNLILARTKERNALLAKMKAIEKKKPEPLYFQRYREIQLGDIEFASDLDRYRTIVASVDPLVNTFSDAERSQLLGNIDAEYARYDAYLRGDGQLPGLRSFEVDAASGIVYLPEGYGRKQAQLILEAMAANSGMTPQEYVQANPRTFDTLSDTLSGASVIGGLMYQAYQYPQVRAFVDRTLERGRNLVQGAAQAVPGAQQAAQAARAQQAEELQDLGGQAGAIVPYDPAVGGQIVALGGQAGEFAQAIQAGGQVLSFVQQALAATVPALVAAGAIIAQVPALAWFSGAVVTTLLANVAMQTNTNWPEDVPPPPPPVPIKEEPEEPEKPEKPDDDEPPSEEDDFAAMVQRLDERAADLLRREQSITDRVQARDAFEEYVRSGPRRVLGSQYDQDAQMVAEARRLMASTSEDNERYRLVSQAVDRFLAQQRGFFVIIRDFYMPEDYNQFVEPLVPVGPRVQPQPALPPHRVLGNPHPNCYDTHPKLCSRVGGGTTAMCIREDDTCEATRELWDLRGIEGVRMRGPRVGVGGIQMQDPGTGSLQGDFSQETTGSLAGEAVGLAATILSGLAFRSPAAGLRFGQLMGRIARGLGGEAEAVALAGREGVIASQAQNAINQAQRASRLYRQILDRFPEGTQLLRDSEGGLYTLMPETGEFRPLMGRYPGDTAPVSDPEFQRFLISDPFGFPGVGRTASLDSGEIFDILL